MVIKTRTIERLLSFLFNILDKLFFKKEYIVFSTRSAKAYADNSKVLFEALLSKNPQKTFFFTKKKKILATIPKNGIYAYSPKGLYILLKSKLLVFTHGKYDFFPYLPEPHSQRTFLNLQYRLPRQLLQIPYDILNRINRKKLLKNNTSLVEEIAMTDYYIDEATDDCFDLFFIAQKNPNPKKYKF